MRALSLLSLLLMISADVAIAEDSQPTEAQVQSAYCLPVLRWQRLDQRDIIAAIRASPKKDALAAQMLADAQKALNEASRLIERYEDHIRPHMPLVDGGPLANAEVRAAAEMKRWLSTLHSCTERCFEPAKEREACTDSCMGDEMDAIRARVNACRKPTWLPAQE